MNITNLEMTQATIEIFAALVCLMAAIIIYFNKNQKSGLKYFMYLFFIGTVTFTSEALAYIFRGNTDTASVIIVRITNFLVFAMNFAMSSIFIRYVYALGKSVNIHPSKVYRYIVDILGILAILILILNLFTGWMYTFDENNYYHRGTLYYAYLLLFMCVPVVVSILTIRYWKNMQRSLAVMNLVFVFVPLVATVFQAFLYGYSITNFGIGISLICMLFVYLREWNRKENDAASTEKMTKKIETYMLFFIMTLSMSASVAACVVSISQISNDNSKQESLTIGDLVSNGIECELLEPIMVSKTMASDDELIQLMKRSETDGIHSIEDDLSAYLSLIAKDFSYQQAFIAWDATRAYYTTTGYEKTLDTVNDSHDVWYSDIVSSSKDYILNLDTDEANGLKLSLFVNKKILDSSGNILGVLGVGVVLNDLEVLLESYEDNYNVDVELVNTEGLVQIASDFSKIENQTVDTGIFKDATQEFTYTKNKKNSVMVKYMDILDWYLIVTDHEPVKINVAKITAPALGIFIAGLFMMGLTFYVTASRERRIYQQMMEKKKQSVTDEMSGLLNRRAYETDMNLLSHDRDKMIIMMIDLNGLKRTNDTLGHEAGDELIVSFSHLLMNVFEKAKSYRVGGDEFVVLLDQSEERLEEDLKTLTYLCLNFKGKFVNSISFAYGYAIAKNYPDSTIDEIIHVADEAMYANKDEYYKNTGLERRK